jgi:hypothetical protein
MVLVPIVAVLVSFVRGRVYRDRQSELEARFEVKGRAGGAIALVLAVGSAVLVVVLFRLAVLGHSEKTLLWVSLPPAVVAVVVSNYLLGSGNSSTVRASWFARWAGMLATADISAFIALCLIYSTGQQEISESVLPLQDQLSAVSYLILSVVFLLIIGGLGWCFYRALSTTNENTGIGHPEGVGDEEQQG